MLGEVMTVEPFHRQESLAVRRLTMRHIGNNAWMMKVGEDLRLADEALALALLPTRRRGRFGTGWQTSPQLAA